MDNKDREILRILKFDARISYKDLGERVHLSANAVAERMRRMEHAGMVQRYTTQIDLRALDLPLSAIIEVKLAEQVTAAEFEKKIQHIPGIIEAELMTGSFDYMLRVACRDQDDLVRITETLRAKCGIQQSYTKLILRSVKLVNSI